MLLLHQESYLSNVHVFIWTPGWVGEVEVEAHVVTIRNAAAADDAGLLNPLLKRWKDETCSQMVFGLPAVRAVINFKWDRYVLNEKRTFCKCCRCQQLQAGNVWVGT